MGGITVLVADDYEPFREAVVGVVRNAVRAEQVIEAKTGKAALEALLQKAPPNSNS